MTSALKSSIIASIPAGVLYGVLTVITDPYKTYSIVEGTIGLLVVVVLVLGVIGGFVYSRFYTKIPIKTGVKKGLVISTIVWAFFTVAGIIMQYINHPSGKTYYIDPIPWVTDLIAFSIWGLLIGKLYEKNLK